MAMAPCEYDGGITSTTTLIANTGSSLSTTFLVSELDKYDFVTLTSGSGTAAYGSGMLPTSIKNNKYNLYTDCWHQSTHAWIARASANLSTGTLSTSSTDYPAMLYGTKLKNS